MAKKEIDGVTVEASSILTSLKIIRAAKMPNVGIRKWVSDKKSPSDRLENQRSGQDVEGTVTVRRKK